MDCAPSLTKPGFLCVLAAGSAEQPQYQSHSDKSTCLSSLRPGFTVWPSPKALFYPILICSFTPISSFTFLCLCCWVEFLYAASEQSVLNEVESDTFYNVEKHPNQHGGGEERGQGIPPFGKPIHKPPAWSLGGICWLCCPDGPLSEIPVWTL